MLYVADRSRTITCDEPCVSADLCRQQQELPAAQVLIQANGSYRLFGGALLQRIDEVIAVVAQSHCQSYSVTTAAIDNLNFKSGAYAGDLLVLIGYVTYTGNTSLEVRIDTYVEDRQRVRRPINRAFCDGCNG